jgi:hypothetical protein
VQGSRPQGCGGDPRETEGARRVVLIAGLEDLPRRRSLGDATQGFSRRHRHAPELQLGQPSDDDAANRTSVDVVRDRLET